MIHNYFEVYQDTIFSISVTLTNLTRPNQTAMYANIINFIFDHHSFSLSSHYYYYYYISFVLLLCLYYIFIKYYCMQLDHYISW